jgi:hypothetical protein
LVATMHMTEHHGAAHRLGVMASRLDRCTSGRHLQPSVTVAPSSGGCFGRAWRFRTDARAGRSRPWVYTARPAANVSI